MLGYHASRGDASMLAYSRDAMAGPLRHLEKVIEDVRKGVFDPDATRSGRFRASRVEEGSAGPSNPGEEIGRGVKRTAPTSGKEELVIQVVKKKLHMVQGAGRTKCGRKITMLYSKFQDDEARTARMAFCDGCLAA